jgi:hypothetical protein
MSKCCTQDCNQGRLCPNKKRSTWTGGNFFTMTMLAITAAVGVSIMWWVITAVMMIAEAIK